MQNEQSKLVRPGKKENSAIHNEMQGEFTSVLEEELVSIPLSDLLPDPNQARHDFSKIMELKESIRLNGQLQPIIITKNSEEQYVIKDGECRWRAMKLLAEETKQDLSSITIKAVYKHGEVDENVGLIINLIRNNYSPFEIAFALKKLQDSDPKLTLEQIGRYISKSRQNVGEYLNLLRLPEKIRNHAIKNNILPFYILKQLAANPRLSEQDKINEYDKLLAIHSPNYMGESKSVEPLDESDAKEKQQISPQSKKLNVINKKLDTLIKSFEKFKVENIESMEELQALSKKLEVIIANANELKNNLNLKIK